MLLAAAALLPVLLAAEPRPCPLEAGAAEISAAVLHPDTLREGAIATLWERYPWKYGCAPVVTRWLVDDDESHRVAAALFFWVNRTEGGSTHVYIPFISELFDFQNIRTATSRKLPLTPATLDQFIARAAAETQPLVLRVEVEQLMELNDLARARALVQAGLALVPKDDDLLGLAFALWNSRRAAPLTKPERAVVWPMRTGNHFRLARSVLSVHGDPEWVAYLSSHLTPDLYEPASLAGLSPRFSKKVLAQARAQLAANKGCYALKGSPLQLRGASAAEILALAEVLVGCEDKLGYFWEDLLTAAAWSPEASKALLAVIQLQGKRGDPAFWRHGSKAISIAGSVGTDEAVEPLLEVLRVAEAPRQGEEHSAWRFADEVIDQLRMLGTAKAGDALVEVARLCTGNCEGGGSCLWRERDTIKNAIEAIGGPERDARYAAVNALVAADKK